MRLAARRPWRSQARHGSSTSVDSTRRRPELRRVARASRAHRGRARPALPSYGTFTCGSSRAPVSFHHSSASVTRVCRRACTARVVPRDRSCCVDVSPQARAFRAPWCAAMACIGAIPRHDVCLVGPPRSDRGGRRRVIMVVLHSPRVCMICSIDWLVLNARARSVLRRLARSWRRGAHGVAHYPGASNRTGARDRRRARPPVRLSLFACGL